MAIAFSHFEISKNKSSETLVFEILYYAFTSITAMSRNTFFTSFSAERFIRIFCS